MSRDKIIFYIVGVITGLILWETKHPAFLLLCLTIYALAEWVCFLLKRD